jgi:type I restriction enzyme S subunit
MFNPSFSQVEIGSILEKVTKPVTVEPGASYRQIGIRSHGKGLFDKDLVTGAELGNKRVFWVEPDCLVINIVFAWEQAVGRTTKEDVGKIASHRFPMYRPKNGMSDVDFIAYLFKTEYGKDLLSLASPGGAGRNRTLGQSDFLKLKVRVPPASEQRRIAEILSTWDQAISTVEKLIENARTQKKALIMGLLTGRRRLPGFVTSWNWRSLRSIASIEYGASPALARKSDGPYPIIGTGGVVGMTNTSLDCGPAIIIGRKGTIDKPILIDGPFWASDTTYYCKSNHDLTWLLHTIQNFRFDALNETSGVPSLSRETLYGVRIHTPPPAEQAAIGAVLREAEAEVQARVKELADLKLEKSALTRQLLTGKRRVPMLAETA